MYLTSSPQSDKWRSKVFRSYHNDMVSDSRWHKHNQCYWNTAATGVRNRCPTRHPPVVSWKSSKTYFKEGEETFEQTTTIGKLSKTRRYPDSGTIVWQTCVTCQWSPYESTRTNSSGLWFDLGSSCILQTVNVSSKQKTIKIVDEVLFSGVSYHLSRLNKY